MINDDNDDDGGCICMGTVLLGLNRQENHKKMGLTNIGVNKHLLLVGMHGFFYSFITILIIVIVYLYIYIYMNYLKAARMMDKAVLKWRRSN